MHFMVVVLHVPLQQSLFAAQNVPVRLQHCIAPAGVA